MKQHLIEYYTQRNIIHGSSVAWNHWLLKAIIIWKHFINNWIECANRNSISAHISKTQFIFAGLLWTTSPPSWRVDAKNIKICRCAMERIGFTSWGIYQQTERCFVIKVRTLSLFFFFLFFILWINVSASNGHTPNWIFSLIQSSKSTPIPLTNLFLVFMQNIEK